MLGVVENLGLHGVVLSAAKIYVGILAATILFIATNAGVIGASRITYAMASYKQLPGVFRLLHPRFKTPWLSILFFAGIVPALVILPGQTAFLGTIYAFGATFSFTVAHASIVSLRARHGEDELAYRSRPNLTWRGINWPLFAILGGIGTGLSWLVIVVQSPAARWAGLGWLTLGTIFFVVYRRRVVHEPLTVTVRAPVVIGPGAALEYRNILVPMGPDRESEEAVDLACRLAAERRATVVAITVIEVPLHKPLDAELPEEEHGADQLLDEAKAIGDTFGVKVIGRVVRARSFGRAVCDEAARRGSEIVVVGADRRDRGLSKQRALQRHRRLHPQARALPRPRRGRQEGRRAEHPSTRVTGFHGFAGLGLHVRYACVTASGDVLGDPERARRTISRPPLDRTAQFEGE